MPVELHEENEGKVLCVQASGKLHKEDYEKFLPEVERLIQQHGKICILLELRDFHGWTAGALWQDIKFDFKHFNHIEQLAIVGESKWQHGMAVFCKPFTTASIRYFEHDQLEAAQAWIGESLCAMCETVKPDDPR